MASNFCLKHVHVLTILLLVLVWLNYIATVISEGNQVEAAVVMNKKCIDKERHALLDIKSMILQDPLSKLSTWGIDDCCKWSGVICNNKTGHVTKLNLFGRYYAERLEGEISPSLLNLTYLTRLDLSFNSFYGTFPMPIGFLTELRYLNLSFNSFNGNILMSIGFLTELRYLDLAANLFNGTIPMSIGFLTELRHLELSLNFFNGTIPVFIGFLTELRYLDLCYNSFNGTIPMSIGSLTELRYLDLSYNSFNGTIPMSIVSLTELGYLDLSDNSFSGTIPRSIGSVTKLRSLDLSGNLLYGTIPPEFGNLTNLRQLGLGDKYETTSSCRVENLGWLSHLSHLETLSMEGISLAKANQWVNIVITLQNLTVLSLQRCNLSQVMYPYLSSYVNSSFTSSSIVTLYLAGNNLNSSISHWLFPLTSNMLYDLDLSGNMLDGIPKYLGNLCSLTYLSLSRNSALVNFSNFLKSLSGCTAATLTVLDLSSSQYTGSLSDDIQNFSSLSRLVLANNQLNGTISEKVWELPNLRYLDISSNSLRGAISENIVQSKIEYMYLSNNLLQGVTFKPQWSKSNFSYVAVIDLSSCMIGPRFPKWIHTLKNLTRLNVARTGISDTIPEEFWDMWPSSLQYLNLSSNNINGMAPDLLSNFDMQPVIDLSSNCFYSTISNVVSTVAYLDLSKNKFYGGISFLCQIVDGFLTHLDLSNNSFSGQLPDCLWHFKSLTVLNLGNNNLSGRLPFSVEYLRALEVLYLYNNNFSGELPLSLGNCTELTFLDLGENNFSGYVPAWIGI